MSYDPAADRTVLPPNPGWLFIVLGVVWMVLGLLAIGEPYVATDIAIVFFGALLLFGGALQTIQAFMTMRRHGFLWRLLEGLLSLFVGVLLVSNPVWGATVLTLLIACFLVVGGVLRIVLAFQIRQHGSWIWLLLSGVIEVFLGLLIWTGWPGTSAWVIGLFIGIRMLFQGSSMLALGLALRTLPGERV